MDFPRERSDNRKEGRIRSISGLQWLGGASRTAYQRLKRNVREFRKSYPEERAARLEWWGEALGIDRFRLLRMIGLPARQAAQRKDDDLKAIVESPEWADNALGLEELLARLLTLHHHDWRNLAEKIRESAKTWREETSPAVGAKGTTKHPHARRNGKTSDVWADRIHEGGPEALGALSSYLITSQAEAERAES